MAWCPKCKFEYVNGIKICPDCKVELVDTLDAEDELEELEESVNPYMSGMPSEEERLAMMERYKKISENPPYKCKEDQYEENKSGAVVLLASGIIGLVVLILNAVGVIHMPLSGFSLTLTYGVMGALFLIFIVSGVMAIDKMKALVSLVQKEKEDIELITDFIRTKKSAGEYDLDKESETYEEDYLHLSDRIVSDVNEAFPELEPGFAFYVVDRFGSDVLDED